MGIAYLGGCAVQRELIRNSENGPFVIFLYDHKKKVRKLVGDWNCENYAFCQISTWNW